MLTVIDVSSAESMNRESSAILERSGRCEPLAAHFELRLTEFLSMTIVCRGCIAGRANEKVLLRRIRVASQKTYRGRDGLVPSWVKAIVAVNCVTGVHFPGFL